MKKTILLILVLISTFGIQSCSKENQSQKTIKGTWEFTKAISEVNGTDYNLLISTENPGDYTNPEQYKVYCVLENIEKNEGDLTMKFPKTKNHYDITTNTYSSTVVSGFDLVQYTFKLFNEGKSITVYANNYEKDTYVYNIVSLTSNSLILEIASKYELRLPGMGSYAELKK